MSLALDMATLGVLSGAESMALEGVYVGTPAVVEQPPAEVGHVSGYSIADAWRIIIPGEVLVDGFILDAKLGTIQVGFPLDVELGRTDVVGGARALAALNEMPTEMGAWRLDAGALVSVGALDNEATEGTVSARGIQNLEHEILTYLAWLEAKR